MRFLFTVASYYPTVGGVQKVTQNIAEELVRQGHEVTVLISCNNKERERLDNFNGVSLKYYNLYTEKDKIIGNKDVYVKKLKELCKGIDVLVNVSVHSALTDAVLPYIQEMKCKTVLYLHGIYEFKWSEKDKSSFLRSFSKIYYNTRRRSFYSKLYKYARNYDLIVHLSEEDASLQYMKKHGINQNIVIHNAAERSFFEPAVSECNEKYFLQVANYAEHKNQEFSLQAFYKADCKDIKMIYIGAQENEYYRSLQKMNEKLAVKFGKKEVEFLTGVSREDTIEKFKHATAVILSSRVEKFPMVLVEGLACGVPFISTDCGSVKTLPGGFIVNSIDEMALQMENILNTKDEEDYLKKREYAYRYFSLERNVHLLVKKLEE